MKGKLRDDEIEYLLEYRKLEALEREKEIKFFKCLGETDITPEEEAHFKQLRENKISNKNNENREKDINRYHSEFDKDKVLVDINRDIKSQAGYNKQSFELRRRCLDIFRKALNKILIRHRAGKRLMMIKNRFKNEQVKNREDCQRMIREDWKTAQNVLYDEKNDFEFKLNLDNVLFTKLPVEYEANIASFKEKIDAEPPTNFDDMVPYDPLEKLDFEIS